MVRTRSKFCFLICLLTLLDTTPTRAMSLQKKNEETAVSELTCLKETRLKFAGRDLLITLNDAEQIKLIVAKYLAKETPKYKPTVPGPGEVFIDCQGTVRMGAWILEASLFSKSELRLTFRVVDNEYLIVRREIRLQQDEGGWRVVGEGRVTYHRDISHRVG